MNFDLPTIAALIGPAIAVYAAIRADIAAMKVQIRNLERVTFKTKD